MEALDFLKEYRRMCNSYDGCKGCPLKCVNCLSIATHRRTDSEYLTITRMVEQWSKEHPVTNKMKICEVFGDRAIYAISSPNVQAIKDWLDEPYKEHGNA